MGSKVFFSPSSSPLLIPCTPARCQERCGSRNQFIWMDGSHLRVAGKIHSPRQDVIPCAVDFEIFFECPRPEGARPLPGASSPWNALLAVLRRPEGGRSPAVRRSFRSPSGRGNSRELIPGIEIPGNFRAPSGRKNNLILLARSIVSNKTFTGHGHHRCFHGNHPFANYHLDEMR